MKVPQHSLTTGLLLIWLTLSLSAEWPRHTIDNTSRGADGVRLADVNGDRLPDIATGWEEGGLVRVYLHPGWSRVRDPWPRVTVGNVSSPEDAFFVDLDDNGHWDVISSCEGKTRTLYLHQAPSTVADYLDESAWKTRAIPASVQRELWMFGLPLNNAKAKLEQLIVSSKGNGASVSRVQLPSSHRSIDQWHIERLYSAGWIMSLQPFDFNGDGALDVLVSDRRGEQSGVLWLENSVTVPWPKHPIGATGEEVMFLDLHEDPKTKKLTIAVFAKPRQIFIFSRTSGSEQWKTQRHIIDAKIGTAKAVSFADIDRDGQVDLVASCEGATNAMGVFWFPIPESGQTKITRINDISGIAGIKFDRLETLDLDGDGDLDVMTCEERDNLGVIWYENPGRF